MEKKELEADNFIESIQNHFQLRILVIIFAVLIGIFLLYMLRVVWKKYIRKLPRVRRLMSILYYKKGKVVPHVHKVKTGGVAKEGHGHSHGEGHGHGEPKEHAHGEEKPHGHGHGHHDPKPEEHGHNHGHGHGSDDPAKKGDDIPKETQGHSHHDIESDPNDLKEVSVSGFPLVVSMKAMKRVEGSKLKEMFEEETHCSSQKCINIERDFEVFQWVVSYMESDLKKVPRMTEN